MQNLENVIYLLIIENNLTCVFWVTARANSSSGAESSGVILIDPEAPLPTDSFRGPKGPPSSNGHSSIGLQLPLPSRFPKNKKNQFYIKSIL